MAILAVVQSYPTDEVLGGDGAYVVALAEYLRQVGNEVHGLVTDVSRGRTNPIYESAYAIEQFSSWNVRNAVRVGKRDFFAPHPGHLLRAINKLSRNRLFAGSRKIEPAENWAQREACWVKQKLEELRPDAVILVHEAVHFAQFLDGVGAKFALLGHIPAAAPPVQPVRGWSGGLAREQDCGNLRNSPAFKARLASALAYADCVGMNSREDMTYVETDLGHRSTIFVGMGYRGVEIQSESDEPVVLFVGNATLPNMEGLSWFVTNVWPNVLASCPAARLRVVGRAALAMDGLGERQIERVGVVNDLSLEYSRAQLVIVPLVSGSTGVKIKVAEAVANGRPIVTTPLGVDAQDPHQLDNGAIVAANASDFADAVIALLRDPELRKIKGEGARKVFAEQFSYDACYGEIVRWLKRIS